VTVQDLPAVNATLNGIATLFLLGGWYAVKKKDDRDLHRYLMVAALVCSAAFLACYLYYHYFARITPYDGEGFMRILYFAILITHVPLAALMVPFIIAAVWFAYKKQFERHTKITKWLWPVWMYVSVTGVLIYLMLYQL
jgi:putative membrane protein